MAPECGKNKEAEKTKALANVDLMIQNVTEMGIVMRMAAARWA